MSIESQDIQTPITLYTAESVLRSPGTLLRSMWRDLLASRQLAWQLTVRDIKARYRQSALGILWAFLVPLATAGIFIILKGSGIVTLGDTEIPYVAFAIIGTTLWGSFSESLNAPLAALNTNKIMLAQLNFPREALILSGMGQVLFNTCIRLVIVFAIFLIFHLEPTWGMLLAPLAMLMLMLLGIVIGMALIPLGMLYTDITQVLGVVTTIWLFVTPVLYPAPEQGFLAALTTVNPVAPIIVGARDLLTLGTLPDVVPFAIVSGLTIVGLLVMWVIYRVSLPILIERISA